MDKKQNPLTAIIFMTGILCAFIIGISVYLFSQKLPFSLGFMAILLLMMAMGLIYVALRGIVKRIDDLEGK